MGGKGGKIAKAKIAKSKKKYSDDDSLDEDDSDDFVPLKKTKKTALASSASSLSSSAPSGTILKKYQTTIVNIAAPKPEKQPRVLKKKDIPSSQTAMDDEPKIFSSIAAINEDEEDMISLSLEQAIQMRRGEKRKEEEQLFKDKDPSPKKPKAVKSVKDDVNALSDDLTNSLKVSAPLKKAPVRSARPKKMTHVSDLSDSEVYCIS